MMTNAQLATASLDDIVFDGRNRGYGAYELRALYQRHVARALIIAAAVCALLLGFPLVAQLLRGRLPAAPPRVIVDSVLLAPPIDPAVIVPPLAVPPVAPPVPPPVAATLRFTTLVAAPDDRVTEEVPEQASLADARVSTVTTEDSAGPDLAPVEAVESPKELEGVVDHHVSVAVEQMPELPGGGGQTAIVAAIQRAVKYPAMALHNGVEGKVYASFTVNATGEIIDLKIVRGLGSGLDEETLRAIRSLPRFIPGKQNGRGVSVSFTVPVTYQIQ